MNDYKSGYEAGYKAAEIISSPINTNGHTYDFYLSTKELYENAINPFRPKYSDIPSEWLDGYGEGFDDYSRSVIK